ncbi:MAG: hypothetical protein AMXMBFR64_35100 [Myxococcales bacterium]
MYTRTRFALALLLALGACSDDTTTPGATDPDGLGADADGASGTIDTGDAAEPGDGGGSLDVFIDKGDGTNTKDSGGLDAEGDVPPLCGVFGVPCLANGDCCSGYCVETFDGFQCTDECLENCPEGWACKVVSNTPPDVVSICVPNLSKLCHECKTNLQCNGGTCIPLGAGTYCTVDCSVDSCPTGYDCVESADGAMQCLPANGTCDCDAANAGAQRPCANQNEFGICNGVEVCDATTGWGSCNAKNPAEEVCDGVDNDCDGVADEDFQQAEPCEATSDLGTCTGVATCQGASGWVCSASQPQEELCDFLDNDCDGSTDEGFKGTDGKYATLNHCGGCGKDCEGLFPNAVAKCDGSAVTPQCAVDTCEPGYYKANDYQCLVQQNTTCQPCVADFQCAGGACVTIGEGSFCTMLCTSTDQCGGGALCLPVAAPDGTPKGQGCTPTSGSCDCSPKTEGQKRPCTATNNLGTCYGFETCQGDAGWSTCDAVPPGFEDCNGLDDDCNGLVDDGLPVTMPCESTWPGVGTCGGESSCFGSAGWVCSAPKPTVEVCDYKDNDCDGAVDEPFKNAAGKYATVDHCGSCGTKCENAIPNATAKCEASGTTPLCVVAECAPGFYKLNDFICLKEGDSWCSACLTDAQCNGKECVQIADGLFCSTACVVNEDCPEGFGCQDVDDPDTGGKAGFCVPANGACDCNPDTNGAKKPCEATNDIGTCVGFSVCAAQTGWGPCGAADPAVEVCDGIDNDCNGFIDDGLPATQPCEVSNAFGSCAGTATCAGTQGWLCSAKTPAAETCNFLDDDCDGQVDEDYKTDGKYASSQHCGTCNAVCDGAIENAASETCDGTKAKPQCVVQECDPGFYKLNDFQCIAQPKVTCFPCTSDANCFGGACVTLGDGKACVDKCAVQADCSAGFTCQGGQCMPQSGSCDCTEATKGVKKFCANENATGTCVGFSTCNPATGWSPCDAPTPAAETCNGLDDDCDGIPDDGMPVTQPCQNTSPFGVCNGDAVCSGGLGWVCQAPTPTAETCDFKDNDCDGQIDEDFKNAGGKYGSMQHCGTCNKACGATIANALTEVCDASKQVPQCIVSECQPGYFKQNELSCVPNPAIACTPCVADDTCFGGKCTTVGAGKFCLEQCSGNTCKAGYTCSGGVCKPDNNSCDCTAATAGAKRTCTKINALGTCLGFETCDPAVGWAGCTAELAKAEECDGKDNDCNGLIDDGLPAKEACANKNGYGTCAGFASCFGTAGWVCQAPVPGPEECDFKDNDCDGLTDEDFKDGTGKYSSVQNCGTCGNVCGDKYPYSAVEVCDASKSVPQCIVSVCEEGYLKLSDFQCLEIPAVACEPCSTDANCFGSTCAQVDTGLFCLESCDAGACPEGYFCSDNLCRPWNGTCDCTVETAGNKRTCSLTNPIGKCFGFETCVPASGWSTCDAVPPATETCNGKDDDCNGFIDDGLPPTQSCQVTNQFGTCTGTSVCYGTIGWFCQAPKPEAETCNYKDDDCDGLTDETFKNGQGKYGSQAHCGGCNTSCDGAVINGTAVCDATKPVPQCVVESCALGWEKYNDFLCIPITSTLCEPCAVDENCVVEGAKCVGLLDGLRCGIACNIDTDCPAGYLCEDPGVGSKQCIPATGSCDCDGSNLDLQVACKQEYQAPGGPVTTCFGTAYCTASGWTPCVLPSEVCNGVDDDCDGLADETFKDASGKYVTDAHCGKCNLNCAAINFINASGVCDTAPATPDCAMKCDVGFFDTNKNPADGCECKWTSSVDYPDGVDQNCDGIDGDISVGIFVAKNGNDANPGTIALPKLTIQAGIDAAVSGGKRDVYVQTGVYSESVALAAGVGVYGGYNADYHVRDVLLYETAVIGVAPTAQKKGAVNALDIKGVGEKTVFDGFTVFGVNNNAPGGNSYGIYARNCDGRLVVRNNRVIAGSGGNGAAGSKGGDGALGGVGAGGVNAQDIGACTSGLITSGGAGSPMTCGGVNTSGGKGGDGYCPNYSTAQQNAAESGTAGANGGGSGGGQGYDGVIASVFGGGSGTCLGSCGGQGIGGCWCDSSCVTFGDCCSDACTWCGLNCGGGGGSTCTIGNGCGSCIIPPNNLPMVGADGGTGKDGTQGAGGQGCAQVAGGVTNGEWVGTSGSPGAAGGHGAGGGGGGAGNGVQVCGCAGSDGGSDVGGTGGGGGAGGCAGTGGVGGGSGGGSFAVFLVFDVAPASAPIVENNLLQRGNGGLGGPGGSGGVGGVGGLGGKGGNAGTGANTTFCAGKGGNGGEGGAGGHGAGGGGGCGGASYAIFAFGQGGVSLAAIKSANSVLPGGAGGAGGPGGLSLGNGGGNGSAGAFTAANF